MTKPLRKSPEKKGKSHYIVWTNNGASPRTHINIISIIHSIANSTIANALFSTFKFLQQPEVPRNCDGKQTLRRCLSSAIGETSTSYSTPQSAMYKLFNRFALSKSNTEKEWTQPTGLNHSMPTNFVQREVCIY